MVYPLPLLALNVYQYYAIGTQSTATSILASKYGIESVGSMIIVGSIVYLLYSRAIDYGGLSLGRERLEGTLESLLVTPANTLTILLANGVSSIVESSWAIAIVLAGGWFLFGFNLDPQNVLVFVFGLFSTVIAILGFSTFLGSIFIANRSPDQSLWIFQGPVRFFGGTSFPISALPTIIQPVSYIIPITWAISSLRDAIGAGPTSFGLLLEFSVMYVMTGVLFALSYFALKYSIIKLKRTGDLSLF